MVPISALADGYIDESRLYYISRLKATSLRQYAVQAGDILFSRVADIGRSAVIEERQAGWIMSSNLMRISLDPALVNPFYVQLLLAWYTPLRRQIRRLANAGGRELVNDSIMRKLRFPFIPLVEQDKLIALASGIAERADMERRAIMKLKLIKQGLMADLLAGRKSS